MRWRINGKWNVEEESAVLRICYISNSVIPSRTANSIHVMKMCEAFAKNGHSVILLAPHRPELYEKHVKNDFEFYGVKEVFEIRKLWWPAFKRGGHIYAFLCGIEVLKARPAIVYGRYLYGLWWATLFGHRAIYELHAPFECKRRLGRFFFKHLVASRKVQHIVVISEALRSIVEEEIERKKTIIVAHDGADIFNGDGCPSFPLELSSHSKPRKKLKIGYIGHLYPGRGIDIIIELARRITDAEFYIVGGTPQDIAHWQRKTSLRNAHFLGFIAPAHVHRYCEELDALLMPYQRAVRVHGGGGDTGKWMSPLKMFEYMASGKAIIASDLPVLREVLEDEHNCLLVAPDDIEQWRGALLRLMKDSELRQRLGKQARDDLKKNYTWEARARRVLMGI